MSLRLLPAIIMDNDEDDDGNFTKWMSSYWGHGAEGGHSKGSFRRPAKTRVDRRASLPTVSQLNAMKLNRIHAASMAPSSSHLKPREEKGEVKPHMRARRASSDDSSRPKSAMAENRISTIPELSESFEKRLFLRDKWTMSLNDDDRLCMICHEDMFKNGGTVQEMDCTHRFHKEAARRLERSRPCNGSKEANYQVRRHLGGRRKSADEPISMEKEQFTPRRQLSLRRHR